LELRLQERFLRLALQADACFDLRDLRDLRDFLAQDPLRTRLPSMYLLLRYEHLELRLHDRFFLLEHIAFLEDLCERFERLLELFRQ